MSFGNKQTWMNLIMNSLQYAENELDRIGMTADSDEMNLVMRNHILHMVSEFSKEGHSGFSANYALSILKNLLAFKPLTPLTGEDDEWTDVSEYSGKVTYQNKRYSAVFKEDDGEAYNIDGKVFWEWYEVPLEKDEVGYPGVRKIKSYYSSRDSRVPVTFPYTIPNEPIYEYRESNTK